MLVLGRARKVKLLRGKRSHILTSAPADVFPVNDSLDSSLKKNTAFIKRLRTGITSTALTGFLTEVRTLSLQKYISEIISATAEGVSKLKTAGELLAGVEIVSALHQRFGPADFTRQIGWLLGRGLSAPDKSQLKSWTQEVRDREEKERLQRHRVLLKVVTELWLVGVLRSLDDVERPEEVSGKVKEVQGSSTSRVDGASRGKVQASAGRMEFDHDVEPFPLEVLKELLGHDRDHSNLPLAVLFVKSFSWDVLGVKSGADKKRKTVEPDGATSSPIKESFDVPSSDENASEGFTEDDSPLVSGKLQTRFRNVLLRYLDDVKAQVVRDQKALDSQSRRNAEAYVKSGEVFEDRQANFEKQTKAQEKLIANAQTLCDALGEEMPDLTEKDAIEGSAVAGIGLVKTADYLKGQGDGPGIWEDEDERRFYENLVDLKGRVPAVLLEDSSKKKKSNQDEQIPKRQANAPGDAPNAGPNDGVADAESKAAEGDDQSTAIASKTVGAQVDALLARLPEVQTKDVVDQIALEFCFLNSKASRNRLVKTLCEVPKGRSDLLPLYARFVATLGQYLLDITQGLISYLDDEFRSLQRRKSKDFLGQVRMLNIRYLAELTKFGVVPEHVIFHCFKVCLDDLSRMNIEIIGNLLENCGRYLLRNPSTSPRMISFLETLNRKKSAQHLGQQERMLIENAMYYVDPPQRSAIQQKERTPMDLYIRQMIYLDMTKRNYTKILKSIRKLHWEESEVKVSPVELSYMTDVAQVVGVLDKIFSKPGKVKFSNIHLLAILASALYRYHQDFVIGIIDNVLEQIVLGLEQNDFKFNQRRIADVKYLGELYNYKLVDSGVIFDTLYRIVSFGHEGGTPSPGKLSPLDQSDDFFRIRLVCTVLETCGVCFDRGSSRKKLDFFLTFFQYYISTKDPLPMDIDFIVQDTFALLRPQWKILTDLQEASRVFSEAVALNYKQQQGQEKITEQEDDAEESLSDDDMEGEVLPDVGDEMSSGEEHEVSQLPPAIGIKLTIV
jgi:regulator of nonsense transcripts 2